MNSRLKKIYLIIMILFFTSNSVFSLNDVIVESDIEEIIDITSIKNKNKLEEDFLNKAKEGKQKILNLTSIKELESFRLINLESLEEDLDYYLNDNEKEPIFVCKKDITIYDCKLANYFNLLVYLQGNKILQVEEKIRLDAEKKKLELKENKYTKIITKLTTEGDELQVIDTFKFGSENKVFNILSLPKYRYDIMSEYNLSDYDKLIIQLISNLECGNPYGYCRSSGGGNIGPFQINFIHKDLFALSNKLIEEENYKELYKAQLEWTIRNLGKSKEICSYLKNESYEQIKCLLSFHNRNQTKVGEMKFMDIYGEKGVALYKEIEISL